MTPDELRHTAQESLAPFPLVGRETELEVLGALLSDAERGHGRTVFLSGEPGIGKTRLSEALAREAVRRDWLVAHGRAYKVEAGVPYAPFADALVPVLRSLTTAALATLSRGGAAELALLFPALRLGDAPSERGSVVIGDAAELKTRLFWTFLQFLIRFAEKQPLLIVLENLHWADPSSLELLHFTARQLEGSRVAILCTYSTAEREGSQLMRTAEQSLVGIGAATTMHLTGLSLKFTKDLVQLVFGTTEETVREFAESLYESTRGNPLFLEQTIKSLVSSGRLRKQDGSWHGWELHDLQLPEYVRDLFLERIHRLTPAAGALAELAAVVGVRVPHALLRAVSESPTAALLDAITELKNADVLTESADAPEIFYDFTHPLLRETVHAALGQARARVLHARVAECMERFHGSDSLAHASELAYHFVRSDTRELDPRAVSYLRLAGDAATARHAHREAATYLQTAFELAQRGGGDAELHADLLLELAHATQRSGDYRSAIALWEHAQREASPAHAMARLAMIERRLGNLHYLQGRFVEALAHYDVGIAAAERAHDDLALARLLISKTTSLEAIADSEAQGEALRRALEIAEHRNDPKLLARVHRASALFYLWHGVPGDAASHARNALDFARASGESAEAWSAHWALAVIAAITGNVTATKDHFVQARQIADELHSPVLRLRVDEIEIEYRSATGEWDSAVEQAARSISLARALDQRTLLPRLLVYTAILSIGRGRIGEGKKHLDEAWAISGAAHPENPLGDVHTLVRVYTGMAIYHLSTGDYDEVMRYGLIGLSIADRSGYAPWTVHRLLPAMIEALLWKQDFELADLYCNRLRRDSERVGQRVGILLADAAAATGAMLRGTTQPLLDHVIELADKIEAIPFAFDAARLRLEIARRHVELGDRESAVRQLNRAFEVLTRLGATREIELAKTQLGALDVRPRLRATQTRNSLLSPREKEILRLVLQHKTNKEIANIIGCAPRNVGKHLENACRKLESHNRHEAAEKARSRELI